VQFDNFWNCCGLMSIVRSPTRFLFAKQPMNHRAIVPTTVANIVAVDVIEDVVLDAASI
jgi:hypothetical protein